MLRDRSEIRALHDPVISADGAWVAAEVRSDRGDGGVRVWSTEGDVKFTIERGDDPRFSRDARWVSALQAPPRVDSTTATPTNHRAGRTLVLLNTQDGSRRTFDFVLSYDLTYASTYLLYLQSSDTTPAAAKRTTGTLHQVPLNSARLSRIMRPYRPDEAFTTEHVVEFAVHPTNDHFAYVFHDDATGGDTLHVVKWGIRAWYHGETIEGLRWAGGADGADDSIVLGFLDTTDPSRHDGERSVHGAIHTWRATSPDGPGGFTRVAPKTGDASRLCALSKPVLSADGRWVAAEERPDRGDGDVRVWSTEGDVTFTIERGDDPRFSRDARWVSALQAPPHVDSTTATPTNEAAGRTLVLLDTQDGSRRTFESVLSYDVTCTSSYVLFMQTPPRPPGERGAARVDVTKAGSKAAEVGTLHMAHLKSDAMFTVEDVVQCVPHLTHANHGTNDHFAYVLHDEEADRDTLYLALLNPGPDLRGNFGIRGMHAGGRIEGPRWAHDGASAVFLDHTETTDEDGMARMSSVLYTWHDVPGRSGQGLFKRLASTRP